MAALMRWATDGRWQLDMDSPFTMEGTARPVPYDPPSHLGLTRGARLTRTKQLDFMHRFMASPLVPSFCGFNGGFFVHHAHFVHLTEKWSANISEQLDIQKLISFMKETASKGKGDSNWPKFIFNSMKKITKFGAGTEIQIAPGTTLLIEAFDIKENNNRGKAIFQHKLEKHNITMEAVSPALFTDKNGSYFEVPLLFGLDLASVGSRSGFAYHLCMHHLKGDPKPTGDLHLRETGDIPLSIFPGSYAKAAVSYKRNFDFWREKEKKVKMVQPYDLLLSDPHVSGSWTIGGVANASIKDKISKDNFTLVGDLFGSLSLTAQHGTFQKLFFDLSRLSARLDFNSGSSFLMGATHLGRNLYQSKNLDFEAVKAICPDIILSLQQQMVGPFSFRIDSKINIDPTNKNQIAHVHDSVFAIDWALKVLGSAKATAWFSPKRQEGMVELRFFET